MSKNRQLKTTSLFGTGVTTTVSITLVLFLLGLTFFVGVMGREISSFIKENLSITIELSDDTTDAAAAKLQKQLSAKPYIKSVTFISKDEIKKELIEELGGDPEEILGYTPASNYFDITLKSEYANIDSIKVVEKSLKGQKIVKSFLYSEDTIEMINSNLSKVGTGLLILAVILMFISFTLIRNTIRLNIYAKRFLINTMQLVGATNGFIRKPFVIKAIGYGVVAAIIANIGITALIYTLAKEFPEIISIIRMQNLIILYVIVLALGIILPLLATTSAVNRYLKMNTNNLYHA
ncbi:MULTISPECIES: cell division protein FtsX [unclassified Dysgonomonas]|uniref:cell division protein FtsX n=1 Tax=unclassified Dysgonomonas TaxID=2630389 RepID=UPI000680F37E|nr:MULTISPECIES: permease-like cell division protein FtsX [unclassified Dysgonomonas]MBD8348713.1 FtsX-like permease family protein [Dysgonomonas sp. HGC4]MBF0576180.1 FtsX-like permease family protein [Dysgonomonas sp. GY617]